MTILLDGKKLSAEIKLEIAAEVKQLIAAGKKVPHLAAVLVGNNGASETYVASKAKNCEEVGFMSSLIRLDEGISETALLGKIDELNSNADIDGFIVQLPLPKHIVVQKIMEAIDPKKDVDGFHPVNAGRLLQNLPCYIPATPYGIMIMLERYKIETAGKHCVIIGRSNIVGMPMSVLMSRNGYPGNCTVTLCHSKTNNLAEVVRSADIVIAALGSPKFVTVDMVKDGAVVIDVGITRIESKDTKSGFKICGDVDFENVAPKCSYISPVPGGVGLMTIVGLLKNTLNAASR
ncbi:MAG: bifunctional 5,10-methylene-tetrahydrofolate dehydrogenase/5,10-methylene-tetrahydrofolate cyclohydrolase [Bacteroidetes bacterium]|nr:bifunctional 5,10-methylene-tetrahydrofolate dehydrogenase/5,10-methylene-tetrahydrofolate cyclohydrolase [Bacteroidota bacterium]